METGRSAMKVRGKNMQYLKIASIRSATLKCGVALPALLLANAAYAQEAQPEAQGTPVKIEDNKEIVVTGTLIRGVAPGGTNVIAESKEKVEETGASTVAQLLQTIPQMGSFNNLQ